MRWFLSAGLALFLGACSGDDFASNSADAAAGSAGSGGGAGAAGAGGSSGASGQAGASGSGGAGGVDGGGGVAGIPSDGGNEIPCGLGSAPLPLFYSTLDSLDEIKSPVHGNGSGAVTTGTFVAGHCDEALDLTFENSKLTLPEQGNLSYASGTIAFWYRPAYAHTDGVIHGIFDAPAGSPGVGIHIEKDENNFFLFRIWDSAGAQHRTRIAENNYKWVANEWIHIRVDWDTKLDGPMAHVFFNGVEPPVYLANDPGPIAVPVAGSGSLELGCCAGKATAMFDELAIWAQPVQFP